MFQLTQENLAEAAGLTTRTIEKVESARHRPDEQTPRSRLLFWRGFLKKLHVFL
jgi:transcriptional regulator with XRE-family HTH domain